VPVVTEDPKPHYPAIDYSSEEESWSDTTTTTPYQERNIYKTHCPEGAYREVAGDKVFIITYLPGLRSPIRACKPSRNQINSVLGKYYPYSNNPDYQASLHKPYYHRVVTESEQRAFEEEAPKIIQAYIKPKEEDLAPISGSLYFLHSSTTEISKIKFGKTLNLRLEDNRPVPFKSIKVKGGWISNLPYIIKYTKIRYQEWLFAGGEDSGEKFFIDLWDPKALEAILDPSKDTHPGAQLLRDWDKVKEEEKNQGPTPKRKRGRSNPLNWRLV
jgi:hypothetical protein